MCIPSFKDFGRSGHLVRLGLRIPVYLSARLCGGRVAQGLPQWLCGWRGNCGKTTWRIMRLSKWGSARLISQYSYSYLTCTTAPDVATCTPTRPTPRTATASTPLLACYKRKVWPATLSSCADMRMGAASRTSSTKTYGVSGDGWKLSNVSRTQTNIALRC